MLSRLLGAFTSLYYVQVWDNRLRVVDVKRRTSFDQPPLLAMMPGNGRPRRIAAVGHQARAAAMAGDATLINPFSHPRQLLADFAAAEMLLRYAFKQLGQGFWFAPSPRVVIQPMDKLDGGLTQIEQRAWRELGLGAGAMDVVLYTGPQLDPAQIDFGVLKAAQMR